MYALSPITLDSTSPSALHLGNSWLSTHRKTLLWVTATSPYRASKSVDDTADFRHFWSSKHVPYQQNPPVFKWSCRHAHDVCYSDKCMLVTSRTMHMHSYRYITAASSQSTASFISAKHLLAHTNLTLYNGRTTVEETLSSCKPLKSAEP